MALFELYPKQLQFMSSQKFELLFGGGSNSGKSYAAIYKLYLRAMKPGAYEGVMRFRNASLQSTFIQDWKRNIPREHYRINKTDQIIQMKRGGSIVYFGADDEHKLGSKNLTGCFCEELHEHKDATAYNKVCTLVRVPVPGLYPQVYSCANPSEDPGHWLIERFGIDTNPLHDVEKENSAYIHTTCRDKGADEEYIARTFSNFTRQQRERLLDGRWGVGGVGVVFEEFGDDNITDLSFAGRHVVIGIDDGNTEKDPFAAVRCEYDGDRIFVTREFYSKGLSSPTRKVAEMVPFCEGAEQVVVDYHAGWLHQTLAEKGLPATGCGKGAKSIEAGLDKISLRLLPAQDLIPNLLIHRSCTNLIREMRTYRYDPKTNKPLDTNNHLIDALRYAIRRIDNGVTFSVWVGARDVARNKQRDETGAFVVSTGDLTEPEQAEREAEDRERMFNNRLWETIQSRRGYTTASMW